jgi:hypothetical protein
MPTFEVEAGGKSFEIEAPDQQSAMAALGKLPGAVPQGEKPGMFMDTMKSIPGAFARGVANLLADTGAGEAHLYMTPEQAAAMPTREQSQKIMEDYVTGPLYKPQTAAGRIISAGVENLANPITYLGPGGMALKMGGAVLSGAASEAAGEAAKGTGYEGPARLAGGLAGGAVAAKTLTPSARSTIPTVEQLESAAGKGYDAARNMGLEVKPSAVSRTATDLQTELNKDGINAVLAPKTFSILSDLQSPPKGAVAATVTDFETARRALGHAAKDFQNPTERLAASRAISHIDDYLANIPASDVMAGDAAKVAAVLSDARGNYAAAKRASEVSDALSNAELTAAAANSGQNIANRTRQTLRPILTSEKKGRGFNEDELAQVERVVTGTNVGNSARRIANYLGAGGGLGQLIASSIGGSAGAVLGGPVGAAAGITIPTVLGATAKGVHNTSVARQARILDEMLRSRSPLAEKMRAATPDYSQARAAAIARALLTAH